MNFFLDIPRGWYPAAQSLCCSPDAEIKACAEDEAFFLVEEQCFDAPSMARERRWHFFHPRHAKEPHFSVSRANGYQVTTTVVDYSALV